MKTIVYLSLFLLTYVASHAQQKNFIDQPYIEVKGSADTLVTPDRIYLDIFISEEETKGNASVEELEQMMISELNQIGIDLEKQLFVADASSNFKSYFFSGQKVVKSKNYQLLVYEASTLGKVLKKLQKIGIANVTLDRTEHSKLEDFKTLMKAKAVIKAKETAEAMTKTLGQDMGKAIYVSEVNSYAYSLQNRTERPQMQSSAKINDDESSHNLSFNQFEIKSEVLVRFILK